MCREGCRCPLHDRRSSPKHRADTPVDSCPSHHGGPCDVCTRYGTGGAHRGLALVEVTP